MAQQRIQDAWSHGAKLINCTLMADAMARGYCERLGLRSKFVWLFLMKVPQRLAPLGICATLVKY